MLIFRLSPESHPIAECIEVKTGKKSNCMQSILPPKCWDPMTPWPFACCSRHRLLALPRPSLKLMQYCIELEASLASLGDHGALTNARWLYDSVVDMYPQEREVWSSYYSLELKVRPHITAGKEFNI
jgi:hypothetical protein